MTRHWHCPLSESSLVHLNSCTSGCPGLAHAGYRVRRQDGANVSQDSRRHFGKSVCRGNRQGKLVERCQAVQLAANLAQRKRSGPRHAKHRAPAIQAPEAGGHRQLFAPNAYGPDEAVLNDQREAAQKLADRPIVFPRPSSRYRCASQARRTWPVAVPGVGSSSGGPLARPRRATHWARRDDKLLAMSDPEPAALFLPAATNLDRMPSNAALVS